MLLVPSVKDFPRVVYFITGDAFLFFRGVFTAGKNNQTNEIEKGQTAYNVMKASSYPVLDQESAAYLNSFLSRQTIAVNTAVCARVVRQILSPFEGRARRVFVWSGHSKKNYKLRMSRKSRCCIAKASYSIQRIAYVECIRAVRLIRNISKSRNRLFRR